MAPKSKEAVGFHYKSTPNLEFDTPGGVELRNEPSSSNSPLSPPPDSWVVEEGVEDDDDDDDDDACFESEGSDGSQPDNVKGASSTQRRLHTSRFYSQLNQSASTLFPPFYNRPPLPLPPSPSLTSLLRPSFSTATSQRSTPESSDVDIAGAVAHDTDSRSASTTNLASITKSAQHAPLVPRATPKVPTYEYYGFAVYLASSAAFLLYMVWAYVPSPLLHQMGIHYYPNRWWALAVPCWLVALIIYIYVALASYNTQYLTLPMRSCENLVDETAQVALIDKRDGHIVRHSPSQAHGRVKTTSASAVGNRGDTAAAYQFSPAEKVDWKSLWSISTDAVMDVPIGGVCEILYGDNDAEEM